MKEKPKEAREDMPGCGGVRDWLPAGSAAASCGCAGVRCRPGTGNPGSPGTREGFGDSPHHPPRPNKQACPSQCTTLLTYGH
jgi:hypothetical protein